MKVKCYQMKFLWVFHVIFLCVLCCVVLRDRRLAQQTKVTSFMQIRILKKNNNKNPVSASHTWAAGINGSIISACAILTEI